MTRPTIKLLLVFLFPDFLKKTEYLQVESDNFCLTYSKLDFTKSKSPIEVSIKRINFWQFAMTSNFVLLVLSV